MECILFFGCEETYTLHVMALYCFPKKCFFLFWGFWGLPVFVLFSRLRLVQSTSTSSCSVDFDFVLFSRLRLRLVQSTSSCHQNWDFGGMSANLSLMGTVAMTFAIAVGLGAGFFSRSAIVNGFDCCGCDCCGCD